MWTRTGLTTILSSRDSTYWALMGHVCDGSISSQGWPGALSQGQCHGHVPRKGCTGPFLHYLGYGHMKTESLFLQGVSARLQASQQSEAQPTPGSHAGGGGGLPEGGRGQRRDSTVQSPWVQRCQPSEVAQEIPVVVLFLFLKLVPPRENRNLKRILNTKMAFPRGEKRSRRWLLNGFMTLINIRRMRRNPSRQEGGLVNGVAPS